MWMNPTFIGLLQIVTDMQELGFIEIVSKLAIFAISSCQACEPIICHKDTWFNLVDAAIFKASFVENSDLEHYMSSSIALIRS